MIVQRLVMGDKEKFPASVGAFEKGMSYKTVCFLFLIFFSTCIGSTCFSISDFNPSLHLIECLYPKSGILKPYCTKDRHQCRMV